MALGNYCAFKEIMGKVENDTGVKIVQPKQPIKRSYRVLQKFALRDDHCGTICDGNRALGIATSAGQMIKVTEYMRSMAEIEIVMVKDRLNNRTSGGWADLVFLFRAAGSGRDGVIGEFQLAFKLMVEARSGMAGHEAFAGARAFIELMTKANREYRPNKSQAEL